MKKVRKKIILQKSYTRDTSLIIQELWLKVNNKAIEKFLDKKFGGEIFGLDYLNKGVIEIWENQKLLKELKMALVKASHNQQKKIFQLLTAAQAEMKEFEVIWKNDFLLNKKELISFINRVEKAMDASLIYVYLEAEEKVEKNIYNLAKNLRANDHFFAYSDKLIRNTLKKLYPALKDKEVCITIDELIEGKIPTSLILKKRLASFFLDSKGGKFLGDLESFKINHPIYSFSNLNSVFTKIIKGQVANNGVVVGPVKVIRTNIGASRIRKGDIVISAMTTTALVTGLKRAGAIVTDEGGALCHAAIISRELGIPCIIGTKIATQVLKDGDLVEVDANKGIVKIIK